MLRLLFEDSAPEYEIEREARRAVRESSYPNHEWLAQIKRTGRYQPPTG
jgi:hypothetical protein